MGFSYCRTVGFSRIAEQRRLEHIDTIYGLPSNEGVTIEIAEITATLYTKEATP